MEVYLLNLFITFAISIIIEKKKISKWLSVLLVSISLVCVSGFRYKVGTDFGTYYWGFKEIPKLSFDYLLGNSYRDFIPFERGFSILIWILGHINNNPQFIVFITSGINIVLIITVLRKYSDNFTLSTYLYITTMVYYSAFNGIRQWIASAILFCGIKYLIEKDFKKYIMVILLASTIHISSLIMIVVYFIAQFKPFEKKMFAVLVLFIILAIFLVPFLSNFTGMVEGTRYKEYTTISETDDRS